MLGFVSFLNVEVRNSRNTLDRERAKQNALLGLHIAMGRIQEMAGPDQRVTAPAGVLNDTHEGNTHWTGVWDGNPAESNPSVMGWLVSREAPNPATALGDPESVRDVAWMVRPDDSAPGSGVRVALEESSGGKIGYWVADENTKANVTLQPVQNPVFGTHRFNFFGGPKDWLYQGVDRFRTEVWKTNVPHRLGLETLPEIDVEDVLSSAAEQELRRSTNLPSAGVALRSPISRSQLHDLTVFSRSVLTDVPWGRLKTDATDVRHFTASIDAENISPGLGPGFRITRNDNFWAMNANLSSESPTQQTRERIVDGTPLNALYHAAFIGPSVNTNVDTIANMTSYNFLVMTEFNIRFSIYRRDGSGAQPVVVRWQLEGEFWNPGNRHIWDFWATDDATNVTLRIRGLPTVTVNTSDGETFEVDLNDIVNEEPVNALNPAVPAGTPHQHVFYRLATASNRNTWKPGEVRIYRTSGGAAPANHLTGSTPPTPIRRRNMVEGVGGFIEYILDRNLDEGAGLTVSVPAINTGSLTAVQYADRKLEAWKAGDFMQVTLGYAHTWKGGDNPFQIHVPPMSFTEATVGNPSGTDSSWQFGYGFELRDDLTTLIATQNPYSRPYFAEMFETFSSSSRWGANPVGNTMSIPGGSSSNDYFYTNGPGFVLFDTPQDLPVSVGIMQHSISDKTYAIGSPGYASNWVFDTLFFSGRMAPAINEIRPASYYRGLTFANPHMRLYEDALNPLQENNMMAPSGSYLSTGMISSVHSARSLLIDGGFNVNSLSVPAWEVMLSGINLPIDPARPYTTGWLHFGNNRRALERAFLRFPYSSRNRGNFRSEDELRALSGEELKAQAFLPQIRSLRADEVKALAEGVVEATKSRGRPWRSLREFVDAGVLARLLDPEGVDGAPTLLIGPVTSINDNFRDFKYSPIFLTQQDVLSPIAPFLNVRSDTFLIRGYGDYRNPGNGQIQARAMCEAVVQRVTTPHAQTTPLTDLDTVRQLLPADHPFGRKFKIVSFRWLIPE
jgi:hypothetical protein